MTKPQIAPNCAANLFAAADERIIAFTSPGGSGLISVRCDEACGIVTVDVYGCDGAVRVLGPSDKSEQ